MATELRDKVIVITGGAQGIGATTARALARLGARVAIGDVDQVRAEKLAGELDALALPLDVTDGRAFGEFLDEVERRLGPVDVLVNNAGIMLLAPLEQEDDEATTRQLEINLHGVIHGTREAIKRMRPRARGHIVNVASMAGKAGFPGAATYCATKHAVVGLSEAVRLELRGSGVDISCVMPAVVRTHLADGLVETKMFKSLQPEDVARAIVDVVRRPRFDVYVPRSLDVTGRLGRLVPRAVSEWFIHAVGADKVFMGARSGERAEYEARVRRS
ncbi:NAD(P)-dependent dehydrogenase (short-subunit alcohol dehydrogenase family) [Amycolatopsis bartoniae]|uniref:Short-chain dehydrogenase n=2 Tax=Amycolatopsis bartoniae TaxID=941986 RepID=A0A8H9IYE6_9PSEU|nr:NAD(P)-dependent dehydrogenase (short-subunit alcohol dehydrogenase family) [Amycolatopsis bartoniae]GHF46920.1 short-chain dehydrogenase [Amycolatopsis bartoniae]